MNTQAKRALAASGLVLTAVGAVLPAVGVEAAGAATLWCAVPGQPEFQITNGAQFDCCTGSNGWMHTHP